MLSKNKMKTMVAGLLVTLLWTTHTSTIDAANNKQLETKKIYINDQALTIDTMNQNGYQLVPATLFTQLGATVEWNAKAKSITLNNGEYRVRLPIGEQNGYYISPSNSNWWSDHNLKTYTTLIDGRSYVPLAYTAKKLGIDVEYDAKLKAAKLLTDAQNLSLMMAQADDTAQLEQTSLLSEDELYWLYRITEAEAGGESYEGKMAVAAVVLNRVNVEGWPNNVVDIIFEIVHVNGIAYYQFEPVLNKYIYKVTPSSETKKAVQAAINGQDPTNGAVVFYNPEKTTNKWVLNRPVTIKIGDHVFAQ